MEKIGFDVMVNANHSLLALVEEGKIEPEQALSVSLKPNELAQSIRGRN